MSDARPAPHDLDLVIDFVNTIDLDRGEESLDGPGALGAWLASRGLLEEGVEPTRGELREAYELRDALRAAMHAHNGGAADPGAVARLDAAAQRGRLGVRFAGDAATLAPAATGTAGALAALLAPVAEAMQDGSWRRVKACRAENCRWAFYDFSRNHAGTWCDMAVCGNREKVRAYRGRAG